MKTEQNFTKKDAASLAWKTLAQKADPKGYKIRTAILAACGVVLVVIAALLARLQGGMDGYCWFILIAGIFSLLFAAGLLILVGIWQLQLGRLARRGPFTAEVTDDGTLLYRDKKAPMRDMRGALCRPFLLLFDKEGMIYIFKLKKSEEDAFLKACSRHMAHPVDNCDYGFVISEYTHDSRKKAKKG